MTLRIDAHQHFWQLDRPFDYRWLDAPALATIHRDFLPEDLEPHLRATGIDRTIFVQTQHDVAENRWALGLAESHPWLAGVVGWVDLTADDCEEQLAEFRDQPKFVGIRHVTQDEPDADFIVRPDVMRGLKVLERHGVPFDLLFFEKHLRHADTLARALPELPMVIDHLAKPDIKYGAGPRWKTELQAAARHPNVYCKLSGMVTEADWTAWRPDHLRPYVETALEAFGPRHCMFGSDWPVCELAGRYEQVHGALIEVLDSLGAGERDWIFGRTAATFYGLDIESTDPPRGTR